VLSCTPKWLSPLWLREPAQPRHQLAPSNSTTARRSLRRSGHGGMTVTEVLGHGNQRGVIDLVGPDAAACGLRPPYHR